MSISLHWTFAWYSYIQEQIEHKQPIQFNDYFNETFRDTMENWQSEFLQLIWQVAGLSILWYIGSSQSKESDDRLEEKVDLLIQRLDPENGEQLIRELDKSILENSIEVLGYCLCLSKFISCFNIFSSF
jgi:hypothetical protein